MGKVRNYDIFSYSTVKLVALILWAGDVYDYVVLFCFGRVCFLK